MKMKLFALLAAVLLLAGCGQKAQPAAPAEPAQTPAPVETPAAQEDTMELTARDLFERHLACMIEVMELGELPYEAAEGETLVPVQDGRFPDYASFEEYVRDIYSAQQADRLLNNFPYEGASKYVEQDGQLYLNLELCGGKGYYVDWEDYDLTIDSLTDTECDFTVTAQVTWPGENPQPEPYEVKAQLVLENGRWLMATTEY